MTKKADRFEAYVGYTDGKPHTENTIDEYGEVITLTVYHNLKEAKRRFQDVRRIVLSVRAAEHRGKQRG